MAAEAARREVASLSGASNAPVFEGQKWNSHTITWSLATSPGTAANPFSGYMGVAYEAAVQKAFQAWGAASGLTFVEVADSSQSDIRIGWGDFNTATSDVVGYTDYQARAGHISPNVIIRLEDPTQDALVAGDNGSLNYSGTEANFYQVLLHEIGHALGLADNNDANSVMYYQATGSNNTLDANDIAGMHTLYGALSDASPGSSGTSGDLSLQHLIQAMAAFGATPGASSSSMIHMMGMDVAALAIPHAH